MTKEGVELFPSRSLDSVEKGVDKCLDVSSSSMSHAAVPLAEELAPCKSMLQLMKRHPLSLCGPPVVLFCLVVALCVFGLTYAIDAKIETQQKLAEHVARDTADALVLQLNVVSGAALTLAAFVKRDPDWNRLQAEFIPVAREVFRQAEESSSYDLAELQYLPFGVINASYSEVIPRNTSTDLFDLPPAIREEAKVIQTVEQASMVIIGPIDVIVGGEEALIARYPVFIKDVDENEDWNNPNNQTHPTGCTDLCYDATTRTKFWGFTAAFFYAASILSGEDQRLKSLVEDGYYYRLSKIDDASNEVEVIVENGFSGRATASVQVEVPGSNWQLCVYTHEIEDTKDMRDGLIAMIVIVALILSGLLFLLLVSHQKSALLLEEQLVTNKVLEQTNNRLTETKCVLEAEKQQREALLGRQYDLIACFERGSKHTHSGHGSDISSSLSSSMADKQQATLGRIAALKRAIDEDRSQAPHPNDDIRTFELLGEGTFGKVHRGLWRQTVVAIKIILLPANMSGAEKREKMVVWEAAISSSLSHPNIVQTYTYSIKPVNETRDCHRGSLDDKELGSAVVFPEEPFQANAQGSLLNNKSCYSNNCSAHGGAIHSFEVQLVLEYCDKGCLRDALDQGVFLGPDGLNYPAILDSAEDIARAMLHLHCNNVLHMDLKARNVMLASSGTEGKGVNCKIADFGLAVRIGPTETHVSGCFQGTFTHMAPEVLLEGHVSKAADVYAFGITLWELFTAGQPYKGVPKALLGHRVVKEHRRPALPLAMPEGYRELLNKCWSHKPEHRPTFFEILEHLRELRSTQPFPTPTLSKIVRLDAHPTRATVLQKLAEDPRIEECADEGTDNQESRVSFQSGAEPQSPPPKQAESGLRKAEEAPPDLPVVSRQPYKQQSWLGIMSMGHPGENRGGGGGGGAGGVGTQGGQGRERLGLPGSVVLDMQKIAAGLRSVGDRSSCSGIDGLRGPVEKQGGGGGGDLPEDVHAREGHPQGGCGTAARRKSYPGLQRRGLFAEQQQKPAMQSGKDQTQPHADMCKSDPGLMRDTPVSSAPQFFSVSSTPSRTLSISSSSGRHFKRSHSKSSRSSLNCVLVIGDDDDCVYPENSRGQGEGEDSTQSFSSAKVEVSAMRTKAAFGHMLEPIGEERHEGPGSAEAKRASPQEKV